MTKHLRWVILQDTEVMIAKGKRGPYIFQKITHVFDSDPFIDFTPKMIQHLNLKEKSDQNKLGTPTETVLPFVNGNLQNIKMAVNKMDGAVKELS